MDAGTVIKEILVSLVFFFVLIFSSVYFFFVSKEKFSKTFLKKRDRNFPHRTKFPFVKDQQVSSLPDLHPRPETVYLSISFIIKWVFNTPHIPFAENKETARKPQKTGRDSSQ